MRSSSVAKFVDTTKPGWRGDAPYFRVRAGKFAVSDWDSGHDIENFEGVAYDSEACKFIRLRMENGEQAIGYLCAATYAQALVEAKKAWPTLPALEKYQDMTIRQAIERFGLESLRGNPVQTLPAPLYISDSDLDAAIELWADEPEGARRQQRFYGAAVRNASMVQWISSSETIRIPVPV